MKIAIIDTLGLCYDGKTLENRGLGGSESAVILISKELANLGHTVTVYNNCIDSKATPGLCDNVNYIDHSKFVDDPEVHKHDVVISSRSVNPFFADNQYVKMIFRAKKKVLWMHDTFCEGDQHLETMLLQGYIDEVFTLSDFHSWYVTSCDHGNKRNFEVLKHKFFQTRNGAVQHIKDVDLTKKDRNHFVYNASATKGLIPLVTRIWPEIKKRIPEARLTCIGGFYRFREGAQPDAQEKMVNDLIASKPEGVTFTGVIPQYEIAEILANATLMLYPTAFPETFGISSLESLLYKTPIVTNTFGALEETAVDLACYKIPYSSTNNALFKNINETQQADIFVQTVLNAYNNPYLLYQKQNYCDVVKDIAGWDTVALQWEQHFHTMMKIPYPVEKYRNVSRINNKIARVYNRRFNNPEDRTVYKSYGMQRRVVIISPYRNAEPYVNNHVRSILQQDYDNYLHILIDDDSDNQRDIKHPNIIHLRNGTRMGAVQNQLNAINDYVEDDDIVMLLDGDDWLTNNNTIFHYYNDLYDQGYDYTYGSMWSLADDIPLIAQDWKEGQTYPWKIPYTHLRTMSGSIAKKVNPENYIVDEKWMMSGADNPLFRETISYAKNPIAVKEVMVIYNDVNPLNDYKVNGEEQNKNANTEIKNTASILTYEIETNVKKDIIQEIDKEQMILKNKNNKKILIAIPTNKYIEPETFKSVYDLDVPDGYQTDFQFFYGYQIDQIRNLIAEWAMRYDYLFSVDSDIVLPKDTLVKMINADKDIISGMYIQRIPGTHTLELYIDTGNGGCTNIPIEDIEGEGIVEIVACGMGCALIKGEVFRTLDYPHFYYQSALDHKDTVSEDIYFCKKAREQGFSVWADETIRCEHIGNSKFLVKPYEPRERMSRLEKIAAQDLLPTQHVDYLRNMNISPKVIYDIGACLLHWTRHAEKIWPDAEICVLDATKSVRPFLENSGHKWQIAVLTDEEGKDIDFYENSSDPGGNSYYLETTGAFTEEHKTKRKGHTLDHIITARGWPLPDLIKMDIQGAEIDVLKGSKNALEHVSDIILEAQHVDYNKNAPKIKEVIEFMESIGFYLVKGFLIGEADGDYHFRKR